MIERSDFFCGTPEGVLHEDATEYFVPADDCLLTTDY